MIFLGTFGEEKTKAINEQLAIDGLRLATKDEPGNCDRIVLNDQIISVWVTDEAEEN